MNPLCDLTIAELQRLRRSGEIRILDIVESVSRRIGERDGEINAYITRFLDDARTRAAALDASGEEPGPLTGIPIAVKDNICVKDARVTCGSKILEDFVSPYEATAVSRLKAAGGLVIGKTNLDEFAMGSSNENSYFGPVRNPRDPSRVPGGSSGGSAAAVAYGGAVAALGSDTGGSVRQPASFCGVFGLKPTYGRVSRYGLVAFASSLDGIGVLARSAGDAACLLDVIAGIDPRDATSVDRPVDGSSRLGAPVSELRLGLPVEYFPEGLNPGIRRAVQDEIELLRSRVRLVSEISLPNTEFAVAAYYILAMAEASSNLARYDGVRYGLRADSERLGHMYEQTRARGFGDEIKRRILLGTYGLSKGYFDEYYLVAQQTRTLIRRDFERALEAVDVIVTPTAPTVAFAIGEKVADPLAMYLGDIYTVSASLAGLPALSMPCRGRLQGLPVGIQFIGRPFEERTILGLSHALERL